MLTTREEQFIVYWEKAREKENRFLVKLLRGLPMAIIFSLPILLFVFVVMIFFPEWYTKISDSSPGMLISAVVAVLCIIVFYAYFRMHYKWEMNEQYYLELKARKRL